MKQLPPVDDDVFEALQRLAVPLVDDINSVLRRLLAQHGPAGAAAAPAGGSRRKVPTKRPAALPDGAYELPVLRALVDAGGRAAASEVIDRVGTALADELRSADWAKLTSSGLVRWKNRTQFARMNLVKRGDMDGTAPRGIWAITDQGRDRVRRAGLA